MSSFCTRTACAVALVVSACIAGCATRLPVVTTPTYPDYPVPVVPPDLADDPAVPAHERAWLFLQSGDLDEAELGFVTALGTSPAFYPSDAGLGFVELSRGASDQAIARFDAALAGRPTYVPALLGRGEALLAVDRVGEAITSFEAAVAADPTLLSLRRRIEDLRFADLTAQVAQARAARDAGRSDEARASYERLIDASPDSGFLYVELAEVEQRDGRDQAALRRLEQAIAHDPSAVAAWRLMADLYLAAGDLDRGEQALLRAESIEPSAATSRLLADIEGRRREEVSRPPEYLQIEAAEAVTRGQLAALIGIGFPDLLTEAAGGAGATIVTDARDHWGYEWVLAVAQAGVMRADTNYRFQPERAVTRAELAGVLVRVRRLAAGDTGPLPTTPPRFSDLAPGHLRYAAASEAVALGVLAPLERNTFQPGRAVAGAEAVGAVDRLSRLLDGGP
jgi:tetratricopeptide (TPR) repeat protein